MQALERILFEDPLTISVALAKPMNTRLPIVVLALLAGCCPPARPHECREVTVRTFKVERVVDGDTFKVTYDGESTSVRFVGINAPEKRDPGGPAATKTLGRLIEGKTVRLEFPGPRKRDNFGRLLCRVYVGEMEVGAEMIRLGHAVKYFPRK